MIRRFQGAQSAFHLQTAGTSYLFRVLPTGHLEQLYYGKRIDPESAEELSSLTEKRSFEPGAVIRYDTSVPPLVLEDVCLELSSGGKGDIREPFLELVHADGSRTVETGSYTLWVGGSQPDERSEALTGVKPLEVKFSL